MAKHTSHSLDETQKIAHDLISSLVPTEDSGQATIVGLYGELGAGKTTFTQSVAKAFGVDDTVTSPTFVIEKIYELKNQKFTHLIHIDAYRIENANELLHLGWHDIASDPKNLILVEWPERIADIMPKHQQVYFKHISPTEREIEVI